MHIILCGLPGSGKTTLAQSIFPSHMHISTDQTRQNLFGSEDVNSGPQGFSYIIEDLQRQFRLASSHFQEVVYDATNLTREHRKNVLGWMRRNGLWREPKMCLWVDTDVTESWERNERRERVVPWRVFEEMLRVFEVPEKAEGFDHLARLSDVRRGGLTGPGVDLWDKYKKEMAR